MLVVHKIVKWVPYTPQLQMMDYGDLKSIKIKDNMLCISMSQGLSDATHMIRKNEFIGVTLCDTSAYFRFIHYPAITFKFHHKQIDLVGNIIKELFGPVPKDFAGDLLAA